MTMFNVDVIDNENSYVCFNEKKHRQWVQNNNIPCISVTNLIGKYIHIFDSNFWSGAKALEAIMLPQHFKAIKGNLYSSKKIDSKIFEEFNIDESLFLAKKADILKEWELKNKEDCDRGIALHKKREEQALDNVIPTIPSLGIGGSMRCNTTNIIEYGEECNYPELLLNYEDPDGKFVLSGRADSVIVQNADVSVLDYKTSETIKKSSYYNRNSRKYTSMLFPLNHLMDCNFYHYVMQLSTYAWMIQQHDSRFNIKGLAIIHIDRNNKETIHDVPYLKKEVEDMIADYKKSLKVKEAYDKIKPIVY